MSLNVSYPPPKKKNKKLYIKKRQEYSATLGHPKAVKLRGGQGNEQKLYVRLKKIQTKRVMHAPF